MSHAQPACGVAILTFMSIDLSQPAPRARTLEEAQALIDELWSMLRAQARQIEDRDRRIEALTERVRTLEDRLRANSRNASTPPSADPHRPPAGKSPSGRKRGAQPGHPGKARTLLPPDQITQAHDCPPGPCPACGGAVKMTGLCARHQVIDLPPMTPVATEYRLFAGACRHWLWLVMAGTVAVFLAAATRSAQAAKAALGERFAGILVSDRYCAYAWVEAPRRQLCWAHLLRDFTRMAERGGEPGRIGDELVACTQRMFRLWHWVRDGTLRQDLFACHMLFLRHCIEPLLRQGAQGRHAETARTCRRILRLREALWTFVDTPGVEPTNNLAERTLRGFVIWRQISFGTQSARGARYVERIMTVVGSCKLQGRNLLDFLTQAVQAHWGNGFTPSLVRVSTVAG